MSSLEAARALVEAYPGVIDHNDVAGAAALFAADGRLVTATATYQGRAEIEEFYGARLLNPSRHLVTDVRLSARSDGDVDGDSRFVALVGTQAEPALVWGTYRDVVRVSGGQARFQSRTILIDGMGSPGDVWNDVIKAGL